MIFVKPELFGANLVFDERINFGKKELLKQLRNGKEKIKSS